MNQFKYHSKAEADKALEYWGHFLLENIKNSRYVAVVENNDLEYKYKLELGQLNENESISPENCAPKILSNSNINNDIIRKLNNDDFKFNISKRQISEFFLGYDDESRYENKDFNDDILRAGSLIGNNSILPGTLGGIFQLEEFPEEYFGITNWHVIGIGIELGDPIYLHTTDNDNESFNCGKLFWKNIDPQKEIAIVHFDKSKFQSIEPINICGYSFSGKISSPIVNTDVKKCGASSSCGNEINNCELKKIHSSNAIVKIYTYTGYSIFENQILIDEFTVNGDSGSLIVNKTNDVVGLFFATTEDKKGFSVANNITNIFNHEFINSQIVMINGTKIKLKKLNLKKFI